MLTNTNHMLLYLHFGCATGNEHLIQIDQRQKQDETVTIGSMMIHNLTVILLVGITGLALAGCRSQTRSASIVQIVQTGSGFDLLRNGRPYTIKGVGGTEDLARLAACGGNTIRTWDADGIGPLLDDAHSHSIAVVVGIWLEHQRHGYDHADAAQRAQQLDRVGQFVRAYRDHPAVLAWGVGNEVELGGDFGIAIEQIKAASALIKSMDINHPTMAVIAEIGEDKAKRIQDECPDIDLVGINAYGGMGSVAVRLQKQNFTGPFVITEFGPVGFWETGRSPWGAPYEQTSHAKAEFMRANYTKTVQANLGKQCLGSFAFLWGHKQETTETWFGLLLPTGESTESVDVLVELWTGRTPDNRAPRVTAINLNGDAGALQPGADVWVEVEADDPDGDPLSTQWRVLPESTVQSAGGDHEATLKAAPFSVSIESSKKALITLPTKPGAYRIFATVRDGRMHAGTANLPILIVEP